MDNSIAVFIPNLLSKDGQKPIIGGLERYALDLAKLLTDMGYEVTFHQFAEKNFKMNCLPWKVYGYQVREGRYDQTLRQMEENVPGRVLYASIVQQIAYRPGSICISHGVWWEKPGIENSSARKFYESYVLNALLRAELVVSCDYNFLNVCRAIFPDLAGKKIRVIPNYADTALFYPRTREKQSRVRVLYPRRLSPERGFILIKDIVAPLLEEYSQLEFMFAVDTNNNENMNHFKKWYESQVDKERIMYCHPNFQSMPEVYEEADIVLIPSIYSEGMSFSCLEAMAMGKPIISTNIGGLTNIILNGFNGILIDPAVENLYYALRYLITNSEERDRLGKNAFLSAQAFSKEKWDMSWRYYISSVYPLEADS